MAADDDRFAFHKSHAAQVAHRGGAQLVLHRVDVCGRYWWNEETDTVTVEYEGPGDALLEIGAATSDMLAPGKPGQQRRDSDGDRFSIDRRNGWLRLRLRDKQLAHVMHLPGFGVAQLLERFYT